MENTNSKYTEIEFYGTLDRAVEKLQQLHQEGEKACIWFNEVMLYSDTVTLDGAYMAVMGKTKAEFEQERDECYKKMFEEEAEWKKTVPNVIDKYIDEGHTVLDEKHWADWDKYVPIWVNDIYRGENLGAALEIIKALNVGCDFKAAQQILDRQFHSGTSEAVVLSTVDSFCDRGRDFCNEIRNQVKKEAKKSKSDFEREF